jgi:hypothetical protein
MPIINNFNEVMDSLVDFYESLPTVTKKQLEALREFFDSRGIPYGLQYGYIREEDTYVFHMTKSNFRNWEYYLGMEYVKDEIEFYFEFNQEIIVMYNDCDRIRELYDVIDENEEMEDDDIDE